MRDGDLLDQVLGQAAPAISRSGAHVYGGEACARVPAFDGSGLYG